MTRKYPGWTGVFAGALLVSITAGCAGTAGKPGPSASTITAEGIPAYPSAPPSGTDDPPAPGGDDGPGTSTSAPPSPNARATAEAFAHAWARPHLPADRWLAGVKPYAAPGYARLLAGVNPANVPASAITGPASVISSTTTVNVFAMHTDTGILQISCGLHSDRWLVTAVEFRRQPP